VERLILITNDDGISAPGIQALRQAVEGLGEVAVVAPDRDQSAVSHMISLYHALRAHPVRPGWWAVEGTPTDCVYLGSFELLGKKPDLVLSGINAGPNLSFDVHYSGTVSAAIEGTLLGIPSIAFSLADVKHGDFDHAARFARGLAESVFRDGLPPGVTLNVNVPAGKPTRHQPTFLGRRGYAHSVHRREDPRRRPYYWIGGPPTEPEVVPGSDCTAVAEGIISVTPLMVDMTEWRSLRAGSVRGALNGFTEEPHLPPPPGFLPVDE
jgi:5'-nucleotidase